MVLPNKIHFLFQKVSLQEDWKHNLAQMTNPFNSFFLKKKKTQNYMNILNTSHKMEVQELD